MMGSDVLPFNKVECNFINSRIMFGEKVLVDSYIYKNPKMWFNVLWNVNGFMQLSCFQRANCKHPVVNAHNQYLTCPRSSDSHCICCPQSWTDPDLKMGFAASAKCTAVPLETLITILQFHSQCSILMKNNSRYTTRSVRLGGRG